MTRGLFVGRDRELALLGALADAARGGQGRVVTVSGVPGIGKTRLAEELRERVAHRGVLVLWARAQEGSGAPPYWPWTQLLRGYLSSADRAECAAAIGRRAPEIAHLVPELGESREPASQDPDGARFRLFDAVSQSFVAAARQHPLVLVLDDLHWADTPSLRLLAFMAAQLDRAPILLMGLYRDVELHVGHPLARVVADLAREPEAVAFTLAGLSPAETTLLGEHVAHQALPHGLKGALHGKTDGNPLYVSELVRLLATEERLLSPGADARWELDMPLGVREVILRRLDGLSPACHRLLRVAACLGREFSVATTAAVTALPVERILALSGEAEQLGILHSTASTPGRYRFAHALIREALYDSLTASPRMQQHRRIGEALEEHYGADRDAHLAELAHHFAQAASTGVAPKAVDYAVRAAERASRALAHEEAVRLLRLALDTLDGTEPSDLRRCELLLALGEAQRSAGDVGGARATLRTSAELAARLGSAELIARSALAYAGPWVSMGVADGVTISLLGQALEALGEQPTGLRVRVLARLGMEHYFSPAREGGAALTLSAVQMARELGDDAALGYALSARHWTLWGPDDLENRLALADELIELAELHGDADLAVQGHHWRGNDLLEQGDMPAADVAVQAHARLAAELGYPHMRWQATLRQGLLALLAGRFDAAEQLVPDARRLGDLAEPRSAAGSQVIQLIVLRREMGRLGELQDDIEELARTNIPFWRAALALLYAETGQHTRARGELDRLAADAFRAVPRDYTWMGAMICLAETAVALDDARIAAVLLRLLEPYAARSAIFGRASASLASVSLYVGRLAATAGDPLAAGRHFERALRDNARLGAWPWLVRTQCAYGALLVARPVPAPQIAQTGCSIRPRRVRRGWGWCAWPSRWRRFGGRFVGRARAP